ncbi:hypothetical protein HQ865_19175 [Mucilaginibacter mali]|uniref:Peptidase S74 domain-containing protein n=1 Tax=Mucilaginibacter mali TaxID=2740462 RepID=A0A7D4TZ16_9SPHI|nr:hypothetical protein [Mucilaginibacter mali]QKJ31797.1 hypothetical protein HQ865_19175 [Mucilaginibacter mali]
MKKNTLAIIAIISAISFSANAQTNTFPGSGAVGIGTTSPASKLNVVTTNAYDGVSVQGGSTSDGVLGLQVKNSDAAGNYSLGVYGSGLTDIGSSLFLYDNVHSAMRFIIKPSGSVGIGTSTPLAKFEVHGAPIDGNQGSFRLIDNSPQAQNNGGYITLGGWRTSTGSVTDWAGIKGGKENATSNDYSAYLAFFTRVNGSSMAERMHITSTGSVGIGTSTPGGKLHVNSDNSGSGSTDWIAGNFGGTAGNRVVMGLLNGVATIGSHNNALNAWTNIAINPAGGKVGIGTDNPDQLLSVNGTIHSKEVLVDLTGWSDYVLKPAYKLPALSAVKTYIDQNHHLPEIPAEEEMVKNGLNVGEMNRLLMKKVEELTLYLIQLKNELDELKKTNHNH